MKKEMSFLLVLIMIFIFSSSLTAAEKVTKEDNFYESDFFVGFAELFFGENNLTGNIELIEDSDTFEENVDMGRVNFYLRGKIKGKYLITAWRK